MDYTLDGEIAVMTFDDGKANAVSHELMDDMTEGLDRAEREAKAVVILGRTGMFSGGFDLKEIQKGPDAAARLVGRGAHMFYRMFGLPMPLVAGCTGHAIAAGAFMLLASDTRIGVEGEFKIGLNETAIGMTLPVFGLELATSRLSKRHLTAAVIQSQLFSPADAVDAGFLDQVVSADRVSSACIDEARRLTALPVATYAAMKRDIRESSLTRIAASLESG